jgi:hypothetical protein
MAPESLVERAKKWDRVLTSANDPLRDTMLYREIIPFVEFVLQVSRPISWRKRFYILVHGRVP